MGRGPTYCLNMQISLKKWDFISSLKKIVQQPSFNKSEWVKPISLTNIAKVNNIVRDNTIKTSQNSVLSLTSMASSHTEE